jgi:lipopolysaccharide transport system ATP-binding protein
MNYSDSEVLIKIDNVSKKFCRDFKKSLWYGLKDTAGDIFNFNSKEIENELPQLREGEFWANQNISFEVKRGECLGLIGRNGAGKTTLLKMLNGLIKPDTGKIEMCGRVGALIALGAGFNPILTGRENIYVNGSILGLHKKEIDQKLDEIVDFAEIKDAIDAPIRTYSSGMQVRLGFAVAVILIRPDILLLDEVLAVGDAAFRAKCLNQVADLLKTCAVIFVSHNESQIKRICSHAILLSDGRMTLQTNNVFEAFLEYNESGFQKNGQQERQWISTCADILSFSLNPEVREGARMNTTEGFTLKIKAKAKDNIGICIASLHARSFDGELTASYDAIISHDSKRISKGEDFDIVFRVQSLHLAAGHYELSFRLLEAGNNKNIIKCPNLMSISIINQSINGALVTMQAEGYFA